MSLNPGRQLENLWKRVIRIKQDFCKIMVMLGTAYPNYELKKATIELYYQMLNDIPLNVLVEAARLHMANNKFFPSIAELRAAAAEIGTYTLPSPAEAWDEVNYQMRYVGNYGIPQFSHPLIKRAVDAMGWRELCLSETPGIDRAQFLKIYGAYKDRESQELITPSSVKELGKSLAGKLPTLENKTKPIGQILNLPGRKLKEG